MTDAELPPGARPRMTPEQRKRRAQLAANTRWAKPLARQEQADASREALWRRFENQVDPDGVLPEEQRRQLATNAAKAHSARMNMVRQRPRSND